MWHIPELLIYTLSHLDEVSLSRCYQISHYFCSTLKNNLPPQNRPLPDTITPSSTTHKQPYLTPPKQQAICTFLPKDIRHLASEIKTQDEQWIYLSNMMEVGDDYFYWREGAHDNILSLLSAHLHPFLSTTAWELVSGLESIVTGGLNIRLQTRCTFAALSNFLDDDKSEARGLGVTMPGCKSVEVYCVRGTIWDLSYNSVMTTKDETWRGHSVRVEREKGVRMGDVIDELRRVLIAGPDLLTDDRVVLEWRFDGGGGNGDER
jgi:hypothetical protein